MNKTMLSHGYIKVVDEKGETDSKTLDDPKNIL